MRRTFTRIILLLLPASLLLSAPLVAETRYVSEIREITLRTGPGVEYKIISMVKSGTPLTVLAEQEDWTNIALDDGKSGWVLTRFLQRDLPDALALAQLRDQHEVLTEKARHLQEENSRLATDNEQLKAALAKSEADLGTVRSDYDALQQSSADFLGLQTAYKKTAAELAQQQDKTNRLENELARVSGDQRTRWFIIGAAVLLIGMIIGFITKPQRRRTGLR